MIYIKNVEGMGRGLFADKNISKGECVEVSPVLVIDKVEQKKLEGTILEEIEFKK